MGFTVCLHLQSPSGIISSCGLISDLFVVTASIGDYSNFILHLGLLAAAVLFVLIAICSSRSLGFVFHFVLHATFCVFVCVCTFAHTKNNDFHSSGSLSSSSQWNPIIAPNQTLQPHPMNAEPSNHCSTTTFATTALLNHYIA